MCREKLGDLCAGEKEERILFPRRDCCRLLLPPPWAGNPLSSLCTVGAGGSFPWQSLLMLDDGFAARGKAVAGQYLFLSLKKNIVII